MTGSPYRQAPWKGPASPAKPEMSGTEAAGLLAIGLARIALVAALEAAGAWLVAQVAIWGLAAFGVRSGIQGPFQLAIAAQGIITAGVAAGTRIGTRRRKG